jgi:hypothetical protein
LDATFRGDTTSPDFIHLKWTFEGSFTRTTKTVRFETPCVFNFKFCQIETTLNLV